MDQETIKSIVNDLKVPCLAVFLAASFNSPFSLAIDFGARDFGYLFISVDPFSPDLLIKRRARELEQQ